MTEATSEPTFRSAHLPIATAAGSATQLQFIHRLSDFPGQARALLKKQEPLLIYCRSGVRSVRAADILEKEGYTHLYNLLGGIKAWRSADKPVVTSSARPGAPATTRPWPQAE